MGRITLVEGDITAQDTNLAPDIYLFDALTSTTELISVASNRMIGNRDSRRSRTNPSVDLRDRGQHSDRIETPRESR